MHDCLTMTVIWPELIGMRIEGLTMRSLYCYVGFTRSADSDLGHAESALAKLSKALISFPKKLQVESPCCIVFMSKCKAGDKNAYAARLRSVYILKHCLLHLRRKLKVRSADLYMYRAVVILSN